MNHLHWWLLGLSFVLGLVLTFALVARPVKSQVGVVDSAHSGFESPTMKIPSRGSRRREDPRRERVADEKTPVLPYAPYGPGSARPIPGGGGAAGWPVKGHSDTRLYYTPDDPTYDPTIAQVWFQDEESAVRAGFTPWRKSSRNP